MDESRRTGDPGFTSTGGALATGAAPDRDPDANADTVIARPARRRRSGTQQAIEWLLLVGTALLIALLIKTFLFQAFYIPSESMVPTLQEQDRVLVNKLSYRLHDVGRGDIVVFSAPEGEAASGISDFVKRVVGLPGETIEGREGRIFIDGALLEEPYLPAGAAKDDFGPVEIAPGTVFVLGDNRAESRDSAIFGAIPEDDIVGRVFLRIWPVTRLGFL